MQRVYIEGSQANKVVPTDRVPPLLKTARPLREFVKVDIAVPGCPPPAKMIFGLINDLLEGKKKTDATPAVKFG